MIRTFSSCIGVWCALVPVCGNQQCEFGEACSSTACDGVGECRADCPLPLLPCPNQCSHHGSCASTSGQCECFTGYIGDACNQCDTTYISLGAACVFMPGALVSCSDGVR